MKMMRERENKATFYYTYVFCVYASVLLLEKALFYKIYIYVDGDDDGDDSNRCLVTCELQSPFATLNGILCRRRLVLRNEKSLFLHLRLH